jgi:hypothetical protein
MQARAVRVPGFPVLLLVSVGAVGLFVLANRLGQDRRGRCPGSSSSSASSSYCWCSRAF